MDRFKIIKKGYNIKEVNTFLNNIEIANNERFYAQTMRIDELRTQNSMLEGELKTFKDREDNVNKALLIAIEKASEMDYLAKIRYALEGERLKLFKSKWENYCNQYKDKEPFRLAKKELTEYLSNLENELELIMERDLNIEYAENLPEAEIAYLSENQRINKGNCENIAENLMNELLNDEQGISDLKKRLGI